MRPLCVLAAAAVLLAPARPGGTATPAPAPPVVPVVISATVAASAARVMTAAVWRRIVVQYVGVRSVVIDDDVEEPDEARCREAHGLYALTARFEGAPWLPGLAHDPTRAYALVRLVVRNCVTGTLFAPRVITVDGDPLAARRAGDPDGNAERLWERSARAELGRGPLLEPVARVVSVRHGIALVERNASFSRGTVLHAIADAQGRARPTFELTVIGARGRFVAARASSGGEPHAGDYVGLSPDPLITP